MKIKLSKKQWEEIGKTTGWLNKTANSFGLNDQQLKILEIIFNAIPGKEGKDRTTGKITSKEVMDEAMGTMYIQTYYYKDEMMAVERYYDSEYLDQQYHKTIKIPINWDNPQETSSKILDTIEKLKIK